MSEAPDPCPICGKYYPVLEYLLEHIERRHSDDDSGFVARENAKDLYRDVSPSTPAHRRSRKRDGVESTSSSSRRNGGLLSPNSSKPKKAELNSSHDQESDGNGSPRNVKSRLMAWAEYASGKSYAENSKSRTKPSASSSNGHVRHTSRQELASPGLAKVKKEPPPKSSDEVARYELADDASSDYIQCPLEECGELVFSENLDLHIELHQAEQLALDERNSTEVVISNQSNHDQSSTSSKHKPRSLESSAEGHISYFAPGGPVVPSLKMAEKNSVLSKSSKRKEKSQKSLSSWVDQPFESVRDSQSNRYSSQQRSFRVEAIPPERPISPHLVASPRASERSKMGERKIQVDDEDESPSTRDGIRGLLSNAYHKYKNELLSPLDDAAHEGEKKPTQLKKRKIPSQKLGAADLGPYAKEQQMPRWLRYQLERGPRMINTRVRGLDGRLIEETVPENETSGLVPMLAQISAMDENVGFAYFCHPAVTHICKTPREGGFCGYRNIQMLMSYIRGARAPGIDKIPPYTPSILLMQDWIEEAWDHSPDGKLNRETIGKLKGTRKWIGSVEASALFHQLGIDCSVVGFANESDRTKLAYEYLLDRVQAYFESELPMHFDELGRMSPPERMNRTHMPPIYLQEPGHSVTIVGLEIFSNGSRGLVVLDPMYMTSKAMDNMLEIGPTALRNPRLDVMDAYRRGESRLRRHPGFEILTLDDPHPTFPAWQVRSPEATKAFESPLMKLRRLL